MDTQAKILVVDDDPDVQEDCRLVLESKGYAVMVASSGAEGRAAMARDPADVVLLDVMMEEADAGFVTARWLNEQFPDVPVILLSSIADAADGIFDISTLKVAVLVNKPISPKDLLQTVARLIDKRA